MYNAIHFQDHGERPDATFALQFWIQFCWQEVTIDIFYFNSSIVIYPPDLPIFNVIILAAGGFLVPILM